MIRNIVLGLTAAAALSVAALSPASAGYYGHSYGYNSHHYTPSYSYGHSYGYKSYGYGYKSYGYGYKSYGY